MRKSARTDLEAPCRRVEVGEKFSKDGSASRVAAAAAAAAAAASLLLLLWVFFVGGVVLPLRPFAAVVGG